MPVIEVGENADFTVYHPAVEWRFDRQSNRSKSENSPRFGSLLKGKINLVYNHQQFNVYE
ncbi:hypothetical protein D9M68_772320 [compost metagenome]